MSADRLYPEDIQVFPKLRCSHARVQWSFEAGVTKHLHCFRISVFKKQIRVYSAEVGANSRECTIKNLKCGGMYTVTISAIYTDNVNREERIEHKYEG